jgi:uncharacterized membrane protein
MTAITEGNPQPKASAQHKLFWVAVSLKFLNGVLELLGGTTMVLIPQSGIAWWAHAHFDATLAADPNNFIANWLTHWADHIQRHDVVFIALYLIFRGCAKVTLSTMLLKGIQAAYPIAIGLFSLIDLWGARHLYYHFSWPLAALVALDVFVISVIAREWLTEGGKHGPTSGPEHA